LYSKIDAKIGGVPAKLARKIATAKKREQDGNSFPLIPFTSRPFRQ